MDWAFVGYVASTLDFSSYSITNSTFPQHLFRYGLVTRSVGLSSNFGLRINTVSSGTGIIPAFNNVAGVDAFRSIDRQLIDNWETNR